MPNEMDVGETAPIRVSLSVVRSDRLSGSGLGDGKHGVQGVRVDGEVVVVDEGRNEAWDRLALTAAFRSLGGKTHHALMIDRPDVLDVLLAPSALLHTPA